MLQIKEYKEALLGIFDEYINCHYKKRSHFFVVQNMVLVESHTHLQKNIRFSYHVEETYYHFRYRL